MRTDQDKPWGNKTGMRGAATYMRLISARYLNERATERELLEAANMLLSNIQTWTEEETTEKERGK